MPQERNIVGGNEALWSIGHRKNSSALKILNSNMQFNMSFSMHSQFPFTKSFLIRAILAGSFLIVSSRSHSAPVVATEGVNLGGTGSIVGHPLVNWPSVYNVPWLTPGSGMANFIVPVGQLAGVRDDGTLLPVVDLIPLATSNFSVYTPDGEPLIKSMNQETQLGGKVTLLEPQGDISMGIYQ